MRQQAGGLEPEALPAHRIYLRHFADGVAASLADSLLAAAAAAPRAEPSPLADELSAHAARLREAAAAHRCLARRGEGATSPRSRTDLSDLLAPLGLLHQPDLPPISP